MVSNALAKSYLSDPQNEVFIFTTSEICALLKEQSGNSDKLHFVVMKPEESAGEFIESMHQIAPDRIHLATVTRYFKAFYRFNPKPGCKMYFHFHNIELWFVPALTTQLRRLRTVFANGLAGVKIVRQLKYSLKDVLRDFYRKKLIRKMIDKHAEFIILSEAQRFHLSQYTNAEKAIIFPSLVFEPDLYREFPSASGKIRLCVPGSVAQGRREYYKLFDIFSANLEYYKEHYTIDLLGFLPEDQTDLKARIMDLKQRGLDILYYDHFIDVNAFDENLYRSDILLSNIFLEEGTGIQNKETATVFHMVRGAKPGIFPSAFTLDGDFEASVVKFNGYDNLHELLLKLNSDRLMLSELKSNALILAKSYAPAALLKRLIN